MKEHDDDFWRDVLSRVETARAGDAFEQVSLEEAERRMAGAEEELPLAASAVDRMVAEATRPRGLDAGRPGGRVLGFPAWSRRAIAAGLVLAPLVAVAFWKAWDAGIDAKRRAPGQQDYSVYVRDLLDRDEARRTAEVLAENGVPLEAWIDSYQGRCQVAIYTMVLRGIRSIKALESQPMFAAAANVSERSLTFALNGELPLDSVAATPITVLLTELEATSTSPEDRLRLLRDLTPQLEAGIVALRQSLRRGVRLQKKGEPLLRILREQLQH